MVQESQAAVFVGSQLEGVSMVTVQARRDVNL